MSRRSLTLALMSLAASVLGCSEDARPASGGAEGGSASAIEAGIESSADPAASVGAASVDAAAPDAGPAEPLSPGAPAPIPPLDLEEVAVATVPVAAGGAGGALAGGTPAGLGAPTQVPVSPGPFDLLAQQLPDAVPDAMSLGALIATAESAIRDPATTAADLAGWGALQQRSYRLLRQHPEWLEDAVIQAPQGLVRDAVQRNALAGARLSATTPTETELPDWVIVTPPPADELLVMYHEAAERFDIPWGYLAAIHLIETRMGRIRGLSTAGAQGPMQFLPSTWAEYGLGGDIDDPRDAINAAANYLAASGGPDDMDRAIFAYNHSRAYVLAVTMYALNMLDDERAVRGYWHWQVYYRTVDGDVHLPEGWTAPEAPPSEAG